MRSIIYRIDLFHKDLIRRGIKPMFAKLIANTRYISIPYILGPELENKIKELLVSKETLRVYNNDDDSFYMF